MKYRFQVPIKAEDYYQFREYHLLHTPEGKQQIRRERISGIIVIVACMVLVLCVYWEMEAIRDHYKSLVERTVRIFILGGLYQIFLVK